MLEIIALTVLGAISSHAAEAPAKYRNLPLVVASWLMIAAQPFVLAFPAVDGDGISRLWDAVLVTALPAGPVDVHARGSTRRVQHHRRHLHQRLPPE
ncbi:hypothetical protein [Kitasatospora griseola]